MVISATSYIFILAFIDKYKRNKEIIDSDYLGLKIYYGYTIRYNNYGGRSKVREYPKYEYWESSTIMSPGGHIGKFYKIDYSDAKKLYKY